MTPAGEALGGALAGESIEAGVIAIAVNDEETQRLRCPGNPTIRLDGAEICPCRGNPQRARDRGPRCGGHATLAETPVGTCAHVAHATPGPPCYHRPRAGETQNRRRE